MHIHMSVCVWGKEEMWIWLDLFLFSRTILIKGKMVNIKVRLEEKAYFKYGQSFASKKKKSMGRAICTPITFLKNLVSTYTPYKYKLLF